MACASVFISSGLANSVSLGMADVMSRCFQIYAQYARKCIFTD